MVWWQAIAIPLGGIFAAGLLFLFPRSTQNLQEQPRVTRLVWLTDRLGRAGLGTVHPHAAVAMWLMAALFSGLVIWLFFPIPVLPFLAVGAMAIAGRSFLAAKVSSRERRLARAWPGLVDHLRQAVRSGASVSEAVSMLAGRVPDELEEAFQQFQREVNGGLRVDQCLLGLKQRLANPVADRIIESLRMAHEVGGHALPAVLESLQNSVRADIGVREDALARQSWIRAASHLGVASPWIALLVLSGRPETITAYSSWTGSGVIVAGGVVGLVAHRIMARIGRLPEESRWFSG